MPKLQAGVFLVRGVKCQRNGLSHSSLIDGRLMSRDASVSGSDSQGDGKPATLHARA